MLPTIEYDLAQVARLPEAPRAELPKPSVAGVSPPNGVSEHFPGSGGEGMGPEENNTRARRCRMISRFPRSERSETNWDITCRNGLSSSLHFTHG